MTNIPGNSRLLSSAIAQVARYTGSPGRAVGLARAAVSDRAAPAGIAVALALLTGLPAMMASGQELEEVQVTGSRIQRPGLTAPTPVTSISNDEMQLLAPTTLMDALDQLPQFLGSATLDDTSNFFGGGYLGAGGQSNLNLRGVGGNRTLVLLDGRRVVPSNRSSTVDVSLFPQALIQRTEVVTGGASAAYGSDAVTGVTNFIMNTEFEGLDITAQGGVSELGDAENYKISLAAGTAVGERGNFVFGAEGYRTEEITSIEGRDWYQSWGDLDFGTSAQPRRVRYDNTIGRADTFGGLIRMGPLAGTQFMPDGSSAPFINGSVLDASAQTGLNARTGANPNGTVQGNQVGGSGDQFDRESMQRAALDRASLFANFKYQLTDNITGSLQGLYGYSKVDNQKVGYVLSGTWPVTIYRGNPYLPADIQARMVAGNINSFRLDKRVSPRDPLHNGRAPLTTDVLSLSGSLEGELTNGWNWNFYYQYGESNRDVDLYGFRVDRLFQGIDAVVNPATGAITCASTLIQPNNGCVPIDILGIGNVSNEALNWVHDTMFIDAEVTQHATEFVLNGEVFEGWGAGPVFMAAGANWREDAIDQISGDAFGAPLPPAGSGYITDRDANGTLLYRGLPSVYRDSVPVIDRVNAASFEGSVSVWEGFSEAIIPVLSDVAFADKLDVSLAARHTRYEQIGGVWAWKAGIDWQVVDELRFRLTRSRDIRAGNLSEMFDRTQLNSFIDDPFRPTDEIYIAKQTTGGNPEIEPEIADTITYGFVYQPAWLDGAALTVDYYDIKIASAISSIGAQNIVDYCFNQQIFCNLIEHEPSGRISAVDNSTINVGQARTRGVDVEISHRLPVTLFGRNDNLALRLIASHLIESSITPFDQPTTEQVGVGDRQDLHATLTATYLAGPTTVAWSTRWVSDALRNRAWVTGIDVDNNRIPSHASSNLRVSYNLEGFGSASSVYVAVTNIFDRNPGDLRGLTSIYDIVGRSYTVGLRYRL